MALRYKKFQDIHNADRELWQQFYSLCNEGKYDEAKTLYVDNLTQLTDKRFLNSCYAVCALNLTYLQKLEDSTFKQDKIQVSETPPANMTTGQIYFKIEEE